MIRMLRNPQFAETELAQLVTDLVALNKSQIQKFLADNEIPKSGTKAQIRNRIEDALRDESLNPARIVHFLDRIVPWGKQHIFLYNGPGGLIENWKSLKWVEQLLKQHRLGKYLNVNVPLALPETIKVSSILHNGGRLRITAIKKRDSWERDANYDESRKTAEGESIALHAFIHRVTRGVVAFEWDLVANTAFLQISQLPTKHRYEEVAQEFFELVGRWLDIRMFTPFDLRLVIRRLHEVEEAGTGEIRSHGIDYRTTSGRRFSGMSGSPTDPLLGDPVTDGALRAVRESSVGHAGNFYWLANSESGSGFSALDADVHVIIVGNHNRIRFPTPNGEQLIRYVLSRIRDLGT